MARSCMDTNSPSLRAVGKAIQCWIATLPLVARNDGKLVFSFVAVLLLLLCTASAVQAEQVVMHRITLTNAEAAIAEALAASGAGESIEVTVTGRPEGTLVSHPSPIEITIGELTFDDRTHGWDALLYFEAKGRPLSPMRFSGRYDELFELPVLAHRMGTGEIIAESDIAWKIVPKSRLRKNAILNAEQIIGKSPARTISSDRYIRNDELLAPPVIEKGDILTMRYINGSLKITTTGEALESGAPGNTIRVRNSDSNIVVHSTVVRSGEVIVSESGLVERPSKRSRRR